jgi:hypothetical protein
MTRRFDQEPGHPRENKTRNHIRSGMSDSGSARKPPQSGSSSTVVSEVQGVLDQQVVRGARTITNVARSAKRAADALENDAPQIAVLVRGVADRIEEYSRDLENQSITDLYQAASDLTRRQPALVFGVAALTGFLALRAVKSSRTSSDRERRYGSRNEDFYGS